MISHSTCLIATGSWLMPRTHACSQGAGHTRPVNSGKLFVECRRTSASSHLSRNTRSLKSGMMFPSGQPLLQNGMPQSMQRAACSFVCSAEKSDCTHFQSRSRSSTGRYAVPRRPYLRNPRTSAIAAPRLDPLGLRALVVPRVDLDEATRDVVPLAEHFLGLAAARVLEVLAHHPLDDFEVGVLERIEIHGLRVHAARELAVFVEHVGDAAAHAGREVPPRAPEHDDDAARHVLAAVVADALHDGRGAAVADAEALA